MLQTERSILREAFGLMPYRRHVHPQNSSGELQAFGLLALETTLPSTYRSLAQLSGNEQARRAAFFGQALLFDAATIAATVFTLTHFPLPDFTHNGALHFAQNIATAYLEKGLINLPMLAIDGPMRLVRARRSAGH